MDIYNYSPDDGLYTGLSVADIDPLESESEGKSVYLVPAFAATKAPPDCSDSEQVRFVDGDWVVESLLIISEQTLDDYRLVKRQEITVARNIAIRSGVSYASYDWDTDDLSRGYLTGAITSINAGIPLPDGFTWTAADDSEVPMDAAGLIALGAAVTLHVNAQHVKSRQLKAQIEAVEIPENGTIDDALTDLELITW